MRGSVLFCMGLRGSRGWSPKSIDRQVPMIGCTPDDAIFSENSSAPNMLSVSVRASAGCLSALARSASRPIFSAPSSSE